MVERYGLNYAPSGQKLQLGLSLIRSYPPLRVGEGRLARPMRTVKNVKAREASILRGL